VCGYALASSCLGSRSLFGHEGPGLSPGARDACQVVCSIAQYGFTRSINAGVTSGIAMHAWIRQHAIE
jgi:tRNA G18 (ribose-2'-O)-methylase SpoU